MSTEAPVQAAARPRTRVIIVAVVVVVVVAAIVVWRTTRAEQPPYVDQASSGLITLCDTAGHRVTSGKVTDKPLAPIVLGATALSSKVPASDQALGTLYGFQPRAGVDPDEFSGAPIGGPVPFTDHAHPATRVVKEGYSIANFTEIYPANDDGYVQLRLVLSADSVGVLTDSYDTADLRVSGDTWHLVRGGDASCRDAAARLAD